MSPRLSGRVALITGAGKGIGAAVARATAAEGARVCLIDTDEAAAAAVALDIENGGGAALAIAADVASFEALTRATERCVDELGAVDILVANAGISDYALMSEGDPARWRRLLEINVLGAAHAIRCVLPGMKQRRRGHVVLMASTAGRTAWVGEPMYIASKWALVGLGHTLRLECENDDVRVSLIEPSIVDTPLVRSTEEGRAELEKLRSLQASDVARAVTYVVSEPDLVAVGELVIRPVGPGF